MNIFWIHPWVGGLGEVQAKKLLCGRGMDNYYLSRAIGYGGFNGMSQQLLLCLGLQIYTVQFSLTASMKK